MNRRTVKPSTFASREADAMNRERRTKRLGRLLLMTLVAVGIAAVAVMVAAPPAEGKPRYSQASASCYGPGLYGNNMANGKRLRRGTIGIAHRTLPLGTKVIVSHGKRKRMTTVKDRGPFIAGRSVDLTERTARLLGFGSCRSWGVRTVKLAVVR